MNRLWPRRRPRAGGGRPSSPKVHHAQPAGRHCTVAVPGRRTVCACLRGLKRQAKPDFASCYQVLSRGLLALLLCHLDPGGPLVLGLDETIEQRSGPCIEAKGSVPGCGTLLAQPLRQGHGVALAQPGVARHDPLSGTCLGPVLSHGPGRCHGYSPLVPLWPARCAPELGAAAGPGRDPGTDGPAPQTMVTWFLCRRQVEVTLKALRTHRGGETQRQWAAPAIIRTTPGLLGLSAVSPWSPTPCPPSPTP